MKKVSILLIVLFTVSIFAESWDINLSFSTDSEKRIYAPEMMVLGVDDNALASFDEFDMNMPPVPPGGYAGAIGTPCDGFRTYLSKNVKPSEDIVYWTIHYQYMTNGVENVTIAWDKSRLPDGRDFVIGLTDPNNFHKASFTTDYDNMILEDVIDMNENSSFTFKVSDLRGKHITVKAMKSSTDEPIAPIAYEYGVTPNPFNSALTVNVGDNNNIEIYNINGKKVHTAEVTIGSSYNWAPGDDLHSGVYLIKMTGGTDESIHKAVYVK